MRMTRQGAGGGAAAKAEGGNGLFSGLDFADGVERIVKTLRNESPQRRHHGPPSRPHGPPIGRHHIGRHHIGGTQPPGDRQLVRHHVHCDDA